MSIVHVASYFVFVFVFVRASFPWAKNLESVSPAHLSTQLHILSLAISSSDKFDKFWDGGSLFFRKTHSVRIGVQKQVNIVLLLEKSNLYFLRNEVLLLNFSLFSGSLLLHLWPRWFETYSSPPWLGTASESEEKKEIGLKPFFQEISQNEAFISWYTASGSEEKKEIG